MWSQSDAPRAQPAAGRPLGEPAEGSYRLLFPAIMVFSSIGIYSVNTSSVELNVAALFGALASFGLSSGARGAMLLDLCWAMLEENLRGRC